MFNTGNASKGMASSSNCWQSTGDFGCFNKYTISDNVLPTTSTDKVTSNPRDDGWVENKEGIESDVDLIRELNFDGSKIALFSELESVPTKPEDEGSDSKGPCEDAKEDPWFKAYSPSAHMHYVDLSTEDGLEFSKLPDKSSGHASYLLDSSDLEEGKEFSFKDGFVAAVKRYNIKKGKLSCC